MKEKLIDLIAKENKKNPYTDEKLANLLGVRREDITLIRKENNIRDSRERRKPLLVEVLEIELQKNIKVSERELTKIMNNQGFDISRHLIRQYKKEILDSLDNTHSGDLKQKIIIENNSSQIKKIKQNIESKENKPFNNLVGSEGSLKPFIQQAKAAVLYPPNGLHTLILGATGVGKSDLAHAMYEFAVASNMIKKESPFIVFNCADYADNPQLLMAQLFGYVKGAFTGADSNKEGLIEKANGSILFLDEIHRLPPEGQELLFYIIDKGKFRRLGETDSERQVKIMIIAATTENSDSTLLGTFRRRIPMVIELPTLSERPLKERLEIIKEFFKKEASRTKSTVEVSNESLKALLLYDCPGNVGQLRSDIQVSCARSFLNQVVNKSDVMHVGVEEMPAYAKKGLLKIQNNRPETERLIGNKNLFFESDDQPHKKSLYEDLYILPEEIYEHIEQRYNELQNQGMNQEVINYVIGSEIESRLKSIIEKVESTTKPLEKKDLIKIVGIEVANVIEKILRVASRRLGPNMENLYYVLAVHLSTTIERLKQGKTIRNPQLEKIKMEYFKEFQVAKEMTELIEKELSVTLSEDETGFITMYLRMMIEKEERIPEGRIGVVLISHGHVAEGMADVANKLLGIVHAKSVEMSLDESPEAALGRAIEVVKNADEGRGVIILVDMGSLVTFGEIITEKTGIKTRILTRTDTVMVIEAVRRALLPDVTLDEIADALEENPKYISRLVNKKIKFNNKPKTIITMCITGEGSAQKVKELLINLIPNIEKKLNIVTIGACDNELYKVLEDMQRKNEILAIVGTIHPKIKNIPFISLEDILKGNGVNYLNNLIEEIEVLPRDNDENQIGLVDILDPELICFEMEATNQEMAIQQLCDKFRNKGYVKRDYFKSVIERERMGETFFGEYFVIPHGQPEYVNKTSIAIALLKENLSWNGKNIKGIIMLALKPDNIKIVEEINCLLRNPEKEEKLMNIKNFNELRTLLQKTLEEEENE